MAAGSSESTFSRAAAQVLTHLSTRSGLGSWAILRHDADGSRTLAAIDPQGQLRAQEAVPATLGADAVQRVGAPISLPDGSDFGELIGYGDYLAEATRDQLTAAVRLYASLLGGLAAGERALAEQRLAMQSSDAASDPLTGLATRQDWERRLQADEAYCRDFGESATVIVAELTNLRTNNQLSGHMAGDEELQLAGSVVRDVLGGKHFAARLTGDRLAVLLLANPGDDVLRALRQGFSQKGVTVCLALGRRSPEGTLEKALSLAEAELQHSISDPAVGAGSATPTNQPDSAQSIALSRALLDGEISAYFQPIVDLRTGKFVAVEALARWQTAAGMREPDQFLRSMQEAGLLGALFDHILDDGLAKLVEFRRSSPTLRLAVNLEFDSKPESTLLDEITNRLRKYQLPPDALSLELSERQTIELSPALRRELAAIADMGVQLVLDDFGSGFASLETLTTLPISGVKLDRRFTGQVLHGEREAVVVKAMIALAAEAGLSVISVGIESQLQSDRLVRMGCVLGQGYLFSLPQPAAAMIAMLATPVMTTF